MQSLIIVTGASTGMGAATARELAGRGFHVLAGVRRESDANAIRATNIEPMILDITRPEQVDALAHRVAVDAAHRPLWALVNNAAIAVNAPVETLPIAEWRRQFEVNLFGHIAITQALMPALLASSGRVVNISSIGGKIAMATYGAYAGSKFALEAVSDSLRREVEPLGVHVVIVEPGAVRTHMAARSAATANDLAAGMTRAKRKVWAPRPGSHCATSRLHQDRTIPRKGRRYSRSSGHRSPSSHPLHHRSRRRDPISALPHRAGSAPRPNHCRQPPSLLPEQDFAITTAIWF